MAFPCAICKLTGRGFLIKRIFIIYFALATPHVLGQEAKNTFKGSGFLPLEKLVTHGHLEEKLSLSRVTLPMAYFNFALCAELKAIMKL